MTLLNNNFQPNGSFTGVVGMLQRREVDINIGSQSLRHDRMLASDFSPPLLHTPLTIFFQSSDAYNLNTYQLLSVFEMDAWVTYGCLFAITTVALTAMVYLSSQVGLWRHSAAQSVAFVGRTAILRSYVIAITSIPNSIKILCLAFGILSVVMFAYLRAGKNHLRIYLLL